MAEWQIERLSSAHDRSGFSCGKPSLDEYLCRYALQYERRSVGRTYVATLPPSPVVRGYYTLAGGSVAAATLPEEVSRKLPRHLVPVAHLGRLAVDMGARGQRLWETLLLDALKRCLVVSESVGLFAVEVHALDDEARRFYLRYGFTSLADDQLHLYLSMKAIQKLF